MRDSTKTNDDFAVEDLGLSKFEMMGCMAISALISIACIILAVQAFI
jgi:hypothetical protein